MVESVMGDGVIVIPVRELYNLMKMFNGMEMKINLISDINIIIFENGPFKYTYFYMDNPEYQAVCGENPLQIEGTWSIVADELEKIWNMVMLPQFRDKLMCIELGESSILFQIEAGTGPFSHYDVEVEADSTWKEIP